MNKKLLSVGAVAMCICTVFCAACKNGDTTQKNDAPVAMTEEEWVSFWQNVNKINNGSFTVSNGNGRKIISYEEYETGSYELPEINEKHKQSAKVDFINVRTRSEMENKYLDEDKVTSSEFSYILQDNGLYSFLKNSEGWRYDYKIQSFADKTEAQNWMYKYYYISDTLLTDFRLEPFSQIYSEFTFNAEGNIYTAHLISEYSENLKYKIDMQLSLQIVDGVLCEMAHSSVQTIKYGERVSITVIEWSYSAQAVNQTVVLSEQELNELIALIPADND